MKGIFMTHDFLTELEEALPALSRGHRAIAEYILSGKRGAVRMTASALAKACGVSESTVVRFAAAMGFDGYHSLQLAVKESLKQRMTTVQRIEDADGSLEDSLVLDSVLRADADKIIDTLAGIDRTAFTNAADMLLSAKRIYIVGMRSSAVLAQFMNHYFRLLFDSVSLVCPSGGSEIFEHLINLSKGDVVLTISFPRYSTGTVKAAEFARRQGAGIIALTDSETSPIAHFADALLIAKSDMASFVDSLVAPMSIINAMIVYIGKLRTSEVADTFGRLEQIWNEYNVFAVAGNRQTLTGEFCGAEAGDAAKNVSGKEKPYAKENKVTPGIEGSVLGAASNSCRGNTRGDS